MTGIQNELAEVVSQSSLVGVKGFLAAVLASVIDGDADGTGELNTEADSLDFCEGESTSEFRSVAVANSLASH